MKTVSLFSVLIAGILFGFGLSLSTMIKPEVVLSFLRFQDFGLLMVLGGAATVTGLCYQLAPRLMKKPLFEPGFGQHSARMDANTRWAARRCSELAGAFPACARALR